MAVFTAIGAAIFGAGTFGALATAAALQVATGIAVSLIGKSLAGQDKEPPRGTRLSMASGGNLPRSIMFGYGATAGSLVYANYWGNSGDTPNAFFTQVICLTDYPVDSLAQVWVNGELCTLGDTPHASRGYPVEEYQKNGKNHLWVKFYDGTQTTADSFLTGTVASAGRPYGSNRVGTGCAYAIVTSLVNDKLFSGYPRLLFALNGAKLYDVSKDSTAGGDGTQRWNNPATWGGDGDDLPLVQIYNILRGITYGGEWFYGLQGLAAARLPDAVWVEQINKCRALIAGPSGNEATYRSGGEVLVSDQFAKAIEQMLTACQGRIAEVGGFYKPHVGAPSEASVFEFSDDHIISTQAQSFTPFFGLADTINGIAATYPSPAEGWQPKAARQLLNADYEAEDGDRRLLADVDLDMVPYKGQVQRLMKSALAEARRARRHTFVLPPEANILEPNDIITWTSERNGYEDKLFRVDGVYDRADLDVMVDITEVDPTDYDWDQETDYSDPVDGPVVRTLPAPQAMTGWSVNPYTFPDSAGGSRRIGIAVTFQGELDDIAAVRIQVREDFGSNNVVWDSGEQRYDVTEVDPVTRTITWAGILPDEDYEVRGIFIPISDRDTEWSDWLGVTTPDVGIGLPDLDESLIAIQQRAANSIREVRETLQRIDQLMADNTARAHLDVRNVRQEVTAQVGDLSARVTIVDTFAALIEENADGITALGIRVTDIEVAVNDPVTGLDATVSAVDSLSATVTTHGSSITANASAITALEGVVGYESGSATFRLDMSYSPSAGWTNGWALQARVDSGSTWRSIGIYGEVTASEGRIVIDTDQLVVKNGATIAALFDAGTVYIATARIRNLDATNITASKIDAALILQNGTTITALIANNAVTNADAALTTGTTSIASGIGTEITLQTLSFNASSGQTLVKFNCQVISGQSGGNGITFRIKKGGSTVRTVTYTCYPNGLNLIAVSYIDTSPSNATWTVTGEREPSAAGAIDFSNRYLECLNAKK